MPTTSSSGENARRKCRRWISDQKFHSEGAGRSRPGVSGTWDDRSALRAAASSAARSLQIGRSRRCLESFDRGSIQVSGVLAAITRPPLAAVGLRGLNPGKTGCGPTSGLPSGQSKSGGRGCGPTSGRPSGQSKSGKTGCGPTSGRPSGQSKFGNTGCGPSHLITIDRYQISIVTWSTG